MFVAPHTMNQIRIDGSIKYKESYTKAIAMYLNYVLNTSYFIKIKDTGIDSNQNNNDIFKQELIKFVKENNIKIVIDLHGAKEERDFDIEFGTLNNLSADFSTINELEEAFIDNKIINIRHNEPFKGGAITQHIYSLDDVDVIQLEINGKYRDYNNIVLLEKLIKSLTRFIKQYNEYIKKELSFSIILIY